MLQVFTDRAGAAALGNPLLPPRGDIVDRNGVAAGPDDRRLVDRRPPARDDRRPRELAQQLDRADAGAQRRRNICAMLTTGGDLHLSRPPRRRPSWSQAVNALGEPGIVFNREPERLYPQTALAGHVLGWTDRDGQRRRRHGAGARGAAHRSRAARPAGRAVDRQPRPGGAGERARHRGHRACSAEGGTGIVLDVDTGEVVAMASAPTFNPNDAGRAGASALLQPGDDGRLRARLDLQADHHRRGDGGGRGHLDAASARTRPRRSQIGRFRISDDHPLGRSINVPELMVHSSNIATARIADAMGAGADAGRVPGARLQRAAADRAARARAARSGRATGAGRR